MAEIACDLMRQRSPLYSFPYFRVIAGKQLPGQPKQSWSQGWLASLKLWEVAMRATHSSGILRGCTPSPPQFPSFTKWFRVMPRLSRMSSQMGGARVPESPTLRLGAGKWRAFHRSSLPVAIVMWTRSNPVKVERVGQINGLTACGILVQQPDTWGHNCESRGS